MATSLRADICAGRCMHASFMLGPPERARTTWIRLSNGVDMKRCRPSNDRSDSSVCRAGMLIGMLMLIGPDFEGDEAPERPCPLNLSRSPDAL